MTQKKRRIGLVACCGAKLPSRAPASELYQSQLFAKSKFFVEHTCHEWAVLSASHGLVLPHQKLEPYDQTLSKMTAADRRGWSERAGVQLRETWNPDSVVFVVLAGKHYRGALDKLDCEVPLEGLGIGHQLQWLTAFRRHVELHELRALKRLADLVGAEVASALFPAAPKGVFAEVGRRRVSRANEELYCAMRAQSKWVDTTDIEALKAELEGELS